MKQILLALCFFPALLLAQAVDSVEIVDPRTFPTDVSPVANDQLYSFTDGTNKKFLLSDLKDFFGADVNLSKVAYIPSATGNVSDLHSFVIASDSTVWYIDGDGDGVRLNDISISAPATLQNISDSIATLLDTAYLRNDTLFFTEHDGGTFYITGLGSQTLSDVLDTGNDANQDSIRNLKWLGIQTNGGFGLRLTHPSTLTKGLFQYADATGLGGIFQREDISRSGYAFDSDGSIQVQAEGKTWRFDTTGWFRPPLLSADPAGSEGMLFYSSPDGCYKYFDGVSWECVGTTSQLQITADSLRQELSDTSAAIQNQMQIIGQYFRQDSLLCIETITGGVKDTLCAVAPVSQDCFVDSTAVRGDSTVYYIVCDSVLIDSIVREDVWLQTKLNAGDVIINNYDNWLTFGRNTIATDTLNFLLGRRTGQKITTASRITAIGSNAGASQLTGTGTFVGSEAGKNNTGTNNAFFGWWAGLENRTGIQNTFIGNRAGQRNKTGMDNVAIGYQAMNVDTNAIRMVSIGYHANLLSQDNNSGVFIGYKAGEKISNTLYNTFIGTSTGEGVTSGSYNILLGRGAGFVGAGHNNIYIGSRRTSATSRYLNIGNVIEGTGIFEADTIPSSAEIFLNSNLSVRRVAENNTTDSVAVLDGNGLIGYTSKSALVGSQNIEQVLTTGNDANALNIENLGRGVDSTDAAIVGQVPLIDAGTVSTTTSASGTVTVNHSVGETPEHVDVTVFTAGGVHYRVTSKTFSDFTIEFYQDLTGSVVTYDSSAITFSWSVIKTR